MLGLYACALLRDKGYDIVYCTDTNEERLKLSSLFGASPVHAGKLTL